MKKALGFSAVILMAAVGCTKKDDYTTFQLPSQPATAETAAAPAAAPQGVESAPQGSLPPGLGTASALPEPRVALKSLSYHKKKLKKAKHHKKLKKHKGKKRKLLSKRHRKSRRRHH